MLRRLHRIVIFAAVSIPLYAAAPSSPAPVLPQDFAGWHASSVPQQISAPEAADNANAAVLREYGFTQLVSSDYTQAGKKVTVRAFRFGDATGTYGAFTFYRQPEMRKQSIGSEAASSGNHFLFWAGTTLVDATFDHANATAVTQLQQLADLMPKIGGPNSVPPSLPKYLPAAALEAASIHYAEGPVAYSHSGGVLPADQAGFDHDAEAVTANYVTGSGKGTLTLLIYPTPQIAAARERAIQALIQSGSVPGNASSLVIRRNGPLVALTSGSFTAAEANKLLSSVSYNAGVTWNHPEGYISEANKAARLVIGIIYLTAIIAGSALILGIFFGGGRALVRRMRGKPISTLNDDDFISLKL